LEETLRMIPFCVLAIAAMLVLASIPAFAGGAKGPLKVLPGNPRFFTDGSGRAIFLTGSHTWNNLVDIERLTPPANPVIDFKEYLDFLEAHHHNCVRLWMWDSSAIFDTKGKVWYRRSPLPYLRTGPGNALDGKAKFDLEKFDPAYFERVRERTLAARDRGMYVIVMLFNGFSLIKKPPHEDPWPGHCFNAANNVNGIDGDPNHKGNGLHTRTLSDPAITALQEAYVRKVIDTVNDLDNVLYEITNEDDGSPADTAWQYHMIDFVRKCEAGKPKQHPIGMTMQWPEPKNLVLWESTAEWISPGEEGGYQTDPPAADGSKVILNDTDHTAFFTVLQKMGLEGQRAWAWKNFTRGNQTLFMDPYIDPAPWGALNRNGPFGGKPDPYYETLRINMGYTRVFADKMNLAGMTPQPALASSGYCLANIAAKGAEFLVYLPQGPWVTVDMTEAAGQFAVEWFNPSTGATIKGSAVAGGAKRALRAPFAGDAVLYMVRGAEHAEE
jgi:hypothetical protein